MKSYEKIKKLAEEKNISIRELERKCEFNGPIIRHWKTRSNPSIKNLQKVAKILEVNINDIIDD